VKLTAEQFEQIVSRLKSDDYRGRQHENRSSPRVGVRVQAVVIPCTPGRKPTQYLVWVRDISQNGICLLHTEPMPRGSYFLVAFKRRTGETLTALYQVAHCQQQSDRQYTIGAKLDRVMDVQTRGNTN
jgi:hypothetical protein